MPPPAASSQPYPRIQSACDEGTPHRHPAVWALHALLLYGAMLVPHLLPSRGNFTEMSSSALTMEVA